MTKASALCEEDDIIHRLRELQQGEELYYDATFGGVPATLYYDEMNIPAYDIGLQDPIVWLRPEELFDAPEYFVETSTAAVRMVEGRIGDAWLLGAMAAISGHPDFLVENLFGSEPNDFKLYGVYTCRFYCDGEWKEIVADTRLPCTPVGSQYIPISGHSRDPREQWVSLLAKAYAKLHGCYEALADGSLTDALVDLTGGTAEEIALTDFRGPADNATPLWDTLKRHTERNNVVCSTFKGTENQDSPEVGETSLGLIPEYAYCIVGCFESHNCKFVLIRNPWNDAKNRGDWRGAWSNSSTQWDDFPQILNDFLEDTSISWDRASTNGVFFMALEDFCAQFDILHVCRLFPDKKFSLYKATGKWSGKSAGGPLGEDEIAHGTAPAAAVLETEQMVKAEGETVAGHHEKVALAATENPREHVFATALLKQLSSRVRRDGNPGWFNNPQYRISTTRAAHVHMSLMQCAQRAVTGRTTLFKVGLDVMRTKKSTNLGRLFSVDQAERVASTKVPAKAMREVSLPKFSIEPGWYYTVVVHTNARGRDGNFVFRIFSPVDLKVEVIPETYSQYSSGAWTTATGQNTAGGSPFKFDEKGRLKPASRWCLNPQYTLSLPESNSTNSQDTNARRSNGKLAVQTRYQPITKAVNVMLVLRRTDVSTTPKDDGEGSMEKSATPADSQQPEPVRVGLLAYNMPGLSSDKIKGKKPKTNAFGEPRPNKESTLAKKKSAKRSFLESQGVVSSLGDITWAASTGTNITSSAPPMPSPKVLLDMTDRYVTSSFENATVAALHLPAVAASQLATGLVVVPSLSDSDVEGSYVLEVHSDEPLNVKANLETKSKTVVGEWTDSNAGGSHLHPSWNSNPKYKLTFTSGSSRAKVKIVLTRPQNEWNTSDVVGSMMGFYLTKERSILQPETTSKLQRQNYPEWAWLTLDRRSWHLSRGQAME